MKPKNKPSSEYQFQHFAKQWRKHKGLSQTELAERLGTTQSEISKVERLDKRVKVSDLSAVADGLGVSIDDLILVDPSNPDPAKAVYSKIRRAAPEKQKQIMAVVDALLGE